MVSGFPLVELTSSYDSFSYTLRAANLSLPNLAPWRQTGSVGATNYTPIFPAQSNGKPTLPQPLEISRKSGQPSFQTHEISTELRSTHALSDFCDFNGGCFLSVVYSMHTVYADSRSTVQTSYVRLEDSSSNVARRRTDGDSQLTPLDIAAALSSGLLSAVIMPYELKGVVREGDYSQRISHVIEIWKGRYKDEMVALKVFNVSPHNPQISAFKRVSMFWDPWWGCSSF